MLMGKRTGVNEKIDPSLNFLYHLRTAPVSVRENALHMAAPDAPCNSIQDL